jgi:methyl-accepting chemotaxis protein
MKKGDRDKKKLSLGIMILIPDILMILVVSGLFVALAIVMATRTTSNCLQATMQSTATVAAKSANNKLDEFEGLAKEIANDVSLYGDTSTDDQKLAYLKSRYMGNSDYAGIGFYTASGTLITDGKDYSSSEFFKEAKSGKTYISSPDTDVTTGELTFGISTPVWKNGLNGSTVVGVLNFLVKQEVLNAIIEDIKVSDNGTSYIIDKNGNTIANLDVSLVQAKNNIIENAKTDSSLQKLSALFTDAIAGKSGFGTYTYEGVDKFVAFAPISESDGWSIFISAPRSEFSQTVTQTAYVSVALLMVLLIVGTLITFGCVKILAVPITTIMKRLSAFAAGDITTSASDVETDSLELDTLKNSLALAIDNTGAIIEDIDFMLTEMSNGNFEVSSQVPERYVGGYQNILTSLSRLKYGLTDSFSRINQVSEQVSAGSSQVSSSAQTLAQGATEQASSIQELSASIAEISEHVRKNAEDAEKAKALSSEAAEIMQSSVSDMGLASRAMNEISATSKNISKVIKAIDDIAFQTNILALNAAVEAARAGSAGKGFAVVADEVRNLSQKSAEAAKNTTALIESSIEAVEKGTGLVSRTSEGFAVVAAKSAEVGKIVETIARAAQEQAAAVSQISTGIEQVSSVVQMNSATSEESAAASEELSGQAAVLKSQVERFRLAQQTDE